MRFVVVVAALACRAAPPAGADVQGDSIVYITSNVDDADVYVNGRLIGPVHGLAAGIALDPGMHRVELRHDDYFSRYAEVRLRTAQKQRLDLEMAEKLP